MGSHAAPAGVDILGLGRMLVLLGTRHFPKFRSVSVTNSRHLLSPPCQHSTDMTVNFSKMTKTSYARVLEECIEHHVLPLHPIKHRYTHNIRLGGFLKERKHTCIICTSSINTVVNMSTLVTEQVRSCFWSSQFSSPE